MSKKELPSPELLRQLLRYEPDTGKLYWKERTPDLFTNGARSADCECARWNAQFAGKEAFTSISIRYKVGSIFYAQYKAHRIIWSIFYNDCSDFTIDHINGDSCDNRIVNLRKSNALDNMRNRKLQSNNKSGALGVCWYKASRKWKAYIKNNKKNIHLGYFDNLDDAIAARKEAEAKYGFHPNHGRR